MGDRPDRALLGNKGGNEGGFTTKKKLILVVAIVLVVCALVIGVSLALYNRSDDDSNNISISDSLAVQNILGHLRGLNDLANQLGNGSRSVVDAYNASAEFVAAQLEGANFCDVQRQYFTVPIYLQLAAPTLAQVTPLDFSYVLNVDFSGTRYGGNGSYAIQAPAYVASNYGCTYPDDFLNANYSGNIVVVFDGVCTQYQKALNAQAANASAILIVNGRGNALSNWRVRSVTWNESDPLIQIPVLGLTYSLGLALQAYPGTVLSLTTSSKVTIETTYNVLCLTRKGDEDSILVMGAHLDSVPEGPGINDDGSGSASILEIALQVARSGLDLKSKVLFAWWGAEEIGLLGSRYFVDRLVAQSQPGAAAPFDQKNFLPSLYNNNTWLNLNFDMLGSPNFVRYVYNCTTSTPAYLVTASLKLQNLLEEYFRQINASYQIAPMTGGSDFFPFIESGFPASALATGAGGLKTEAEREVFGGFARAAYDTCYHQSCDTVWNIDTGVLQDMSRAAAYAMQKLAEQPNLRSFLYE